LGSRRGFARLLGGAAHHDRLGESEADFIGARDSFYLASVSETGWPYIQHRGGPKGFVRVLDETTIGFADFSGNRQYVTAGNVAGNDRVSLFLMDYPNRTRLKILGHARQIGLKDEALERLIVPGYRARVERGFIVTIAAFDWNCPQHITPRFTIDEIETIAERRGL
jgi:predicted pyridoxine 5'-phosphate oxidase superfamily flavin-nucleotide-binding protein